MLILLPSCRFDARLTSSCKESRHPGIGVRYTYRTMTLPLVGRCCGGATQDPVCGLVATKCGTAAGFIAVPRAAAGTKLLLLAGLKTVVPGGKGAWLTTGTICATACIATAVKGLRWGDCCIESGLCCHCNCGDAANMVLRSAGGPKSRDCGERKGEREREARLLAEPPRSWSRSSSRSVYTRVLRHKRSCCRAMTAKATTPARTTMPTKLRTV